MPATGNITSSYTSRDYATAACCTPYYKHRSIAELADKWTRLDPEGPGVR